MALQPGQQFGRYELMFRLGHGGMAETWRARLMGEAGVTKPVLIKKVLPEYANDEAFTTMFVSEARISATLSHSNIAQVYDFGRLDDEYFLAMEFVDGQPLHRLSKRALKSGLTAIPAPLAAFIAIELCRGLHYAHTRTDGKGRPLGIVHRDISPDNVLVSYEGQVKIVDFGIAKARELRGFNTEPGVVKGKYLFFSPEQARGEEVDARTDVWATGVVLYEMLCGQLPLQGPHYAVMHKLMRGEFPRPRALAPELPEELDDIVMRALALKREERYASCHELGDALAGFLYTNAPRFSAMTLAHFIQELFREDLEIEGRAVQVPPSFHEQLALWRREPGPPAGQTTPSARSQPRESQISTQPGTPLASSQARRRMWKWGAGGVAVALLAGGWLLVATHSAHEGFAPDGTTPSGARVPGDPIDMAAAGTSLPPVRTLGAEARMAHDRAYLAFQQKQFREAVPWALDCIQLDASWAGCELLAADAYAALAQVDEAELHYRKLLELAPEHKEAARVRGLLEQYQQERALRPVVEAAPEPEVKAHTPPRPKPAPSKAAPQRPASPAYFRALKQGKTEQRAGRFGTAEPYFVEALKFEPDSLEAKEGLGFCRVMGATRVADYQQALGVLEEAVQYKDVQAQTWFVLGLARQGLHQKQQALLAFKMYLNLEPAGKYALEARLAVQHLSY